MYKYPTPEISLRKPFRILTPNGVEGPKAVVGDETTNEILEGGFPKLENIREQSRENGIPHSPFSLFRHFGFSVT